MFRKLIQKLKHNPKTIVFTEGSDPRILEASARLLSGTFLTPILVGNREEVLAAAERECLNVQNVQVLDPASYEGMDEMVEKMVELRRGKMNKIVSSCFILVRPLATGGNQVLAMGDCAINIDPSEEDLVEITQEVAKCARMFGVDPKVAMLSYSTHGSGKGPAVDKMRNVTRRLQDMMLDFPVDGEMQFDAAVNPSVGQLKFPGSPVAGYANTFIFPEITAGNIGYKIAQRMGNFDAYGPILLGLNAPINDLSRGCNALEVYSMAIITAALAE